MPTNDANSSANSSSNPENLNPQNQQASSTPEPTDKPMVASSEPVIVMPANTEGLPTANQDKLALAKKSGCLVCHSVEKKIVGPAWRDVSNRYKDVPDAKKRLITKVAKGGSGNWKDVVGAAAMPPYSPRVSDENIAQLVEFVLSLEK
jgi:cytochrome c